VNAGNKVRSWSIDLKTHHGVTDDQAGSADKYRLHVRWGREEKSELMGNVHMNSKVVRSDGLV
jgi:hypothetical protein